MTKDDLPPPLPDCMPTVNALDQLFRQRHNDDDVIRQLIPVLRQAQKLAIAAHDAKRPRVRIWRHEEGSAWHTSDANPALFPNIEFAWAYIEREGA